MTQVDIEKIILENGFKLEDKQGHITYEFGTGDIYRISQLLFKKMNYIPCCKSDSEQLKGKWDITFEQWIELYYSPYNATYMINKHGTLKTKKELRKYFDELKQSL